MTWSRDDAMRVASARFADPAALVEAGMTRRMVRASVADGRLVRMRNGRYVGGDAHPRLLEAGRLGGRLDCVSLLAAMGVFVREQSLLHLQFEPGTARLPTRTKVIHAHWRASRRDRCEMAADVIEALAQACVCQHPRDAIATLDSAWHLGVVDEEGISAVFRRLPQRLQFMRKLLDARSEAGPESLMRLIFRALGCSVQVQVSIDDVGRVDLVVDGWLIVECDSKAFHEGWEAQKRDRRRDIAAATLGYTTIRPLAEDIMYRRKTVLAQVKEVLAHRPVQNSTDSSSAAGPTAPLRAILL